MSEGQERIGEYEVLSRLGAGGMAEVFLARIHGPHGFHRPVVIKRILPKLAHKPSFIDMFLDEAEVVASLNHPNIVQIIELRDDDGLYMVMEYLEGESLSSLRRRRFRIDGQPFDAATVAHVVARVCAALEAAHTARGADGLPRKIVHRDVAPENVFVTYDGHIKLLDFGIVWKADRLSQTEAGQLKGKYPYMSPEQASGETLDGRSDLFSLGALAYELSTGHRLFHRDSQYKTLRAVCEAPIAPPSSLISGYDPGLERIVLRALERDLQRRYQTARDMRIDALRLCEPVLAEPPEDILSRLMHRLFADRIKERRKLLAKVRAGRTVTSEVAVSDLQSIDMPPLRHSSARLTAELLHYDGRIWPFVVGVLLVGAALTVWVLSWRTTEVPVGVDPAKASVPTRVAPPTTPSAPAPAKSAPVVRIELATTPPGAEVFVAGRRMGQTPAAVEVRRDPQPVTIRLVRPGYRTSEAEIVPMTDRSLHFNLERQASVPPVEAAKAARRPAKRKKRVRPPPPPPKYEQFD